MMVKKHLAILLGGLVVGVWGLLCFALGFWLAGCGEDVDDKPPPCITENWTCEGMADYKTACLKDLGLPADENFRGGVLNSCNMQSEEYPTTDLYRCLARFVDGDTCDSKNRDCDGCQ